jgi:hypothetical protein
MTSPRSIHVHLCCELDVTLVARVPLHIRALLLTSTLMPRAQQST